MAQPNLLITGATGFLGRKLIEECLRREVFSLTAMTRSPSKLPDGCSQIIGDLGAADAVFHEIKSARPDVIVHTAYSKIPAEQQAIIVDGTGAVCRAADAVGALLLHVSTDLVFCGTKGSYRETDPPNPALPYGKFKLESERLVLSRPRSMVLRPSLIFDPAESAPWEDFVLAAARSGTIATLHAWERRSPTYRSDLADALLDLAERGLQGDLPATLVGTSASPEARIFHAGGAEPVNRFEIATALAPIRGYGFDALRVEEERSPDETRPADCSLVSKKIESVISGRLRGIHEILARPGMS